MTYLYVFIGGGLGSLARFLTSKAAHKLVPGDFPIGTLISNLVACTALAVLVVLFTNKHDQFPWVQPMLVIGFCGGYSTFSTFGNDTYLLFNEGHHFMAVLNVLISVIFGIGLIFLIRSRV